MAHDRTPVARKAVARLSTTLMACAMVVGLAACGDAPAPVTPSTTDAGIPTASPTVVSAEQMAKDAAVTAYKGYVAEFAHAAQTADPDDPGLPLYLGGALLSLTQHNLRILKDNGQIQVGAQTATVTRTDVDLAASPPTVTVHACLDYSSIKLVYAKDHSPVPGSEIKNPRVPAVATVWKFDNGKWLVTDTQQGTGTC
jgi:hypothetical protein